MVSDSDHVAVVHTDEMHIHVVPLRVLVAVFALLLVLTVLTVGATWVDLGVLNIWIALLIAAVKAGAVGLYFMHLRYDRPFHGVVLAASFLFVAVFIGASLMDTKEYQVNMEPPSTLSTTSL
ncbi:MAG: cytochrome C oxidase subunit IV family protein [Phycisphaerae bacterium]|nr:cytochrome C oxidase subunit IV family protein [Phycisphaerae bacterium]